MIIHNKFVTYAYLILISPSYTGKGGFCMFSHIFSFVFPLSFLPLLFTLWFLSSSSSLLVLVSLSSPLVLLVSLFIFLLSISFSFSSSPLTLNSFFSSFSSCYDWSDFNLISLFKSDLQTISKNKTGLVASLVFLIIYIPIIWNRQIYTYFPQLWKIILLKQRIIKLKKYIGIKRMFLKFSW